MEKKETILDFNPTDAEMRRLFPTTEKDGWDGYRFLLSLGFDPFADDDERLRELGLLFAMRNDKDKAMYYWNQVKDTSLVQPYIVSL